MIEERLAIKQDLKELEVSLKHDMKELEVSLKRDIKALEASLRRDMKELELRMTLRLGSMMILAIVVTTVLVELL